ncbi:MAG: hypothetical protein C4560_11135 [Nitrospiraceae bacterium]|nr:MAG: hypothetical protein C4560_11135 [Nitrospiraceae bacterium]
MINKLFSSVKTAVFLLFSLVIILVLGTIFFQEHNNKENTVKRLFSGSDSVMPVFNIFDSVVFFLFIVVIILLIVSLTVCSFNRYKAFRKKGEISFEEFRNYQGVIALKSDKVDQLLKEEGFTPNKQKDNSIIKTYEKGVSLSWVSWFYHIGVILAILGFLAAGLFTKEVFPFLYEGKPEIVSFETKKTKFEDFLGKIGFNHAGKEDARYTIKLKEITKETYKVPLIKFPDDKIKRFLLGTGLQKIEYLKDNFSYVQKRWLARLEITNNKNDDILDVVMQPNEPLEIDDISVYLIEPSASLKFNVADETVNIKSGELFQVKNFEGKFVVDYPKHPEIVFRKDNTIIENNKGLLPPMSLYYIPPALPQKKEKIGDIRLGEAVLFKGAPVRLLEYNRTCLFGFKKDPGFVFISFACGFIVIGLFVISFGSWYRVQLAVDNGTTYVLINTKGVRADRKRLLQKLPGDS